jgi:hypothetical protein
VIKYALFDFKAPPIETDFTPSNSQNNKFQSKHELFINNYDISTIPFHLSHATPSATNSFHYTPNSIEKQKNHEQKSPKYNLDNRDNAVVETDFLYDNNAVTTNNIQLTINPFEVDFDTADTYMDKENSEYDFTDEEERQLIIARKLLRDDITYGKRAYHNVLKKE